MTDGHIYAIIICSTLLSLLGLLAVASYYAKDRNGK